MKPSLLALIVAAVLSAVAAVAIAGLPAGSTNSIVIDTPATTAPTTLAPTTTVTAPTTTAPPEESDGAETTEVPSTEPANGGTTTDTTTTTEAVEQLVPRAEVIVGVANAANRSGLASRTAAVLRDLGYVDVRTADSLTLVPVVAYVADGLEGEALRLLEDLELGNGTIAPLADAPTVEPAPGDVAILLVLGTETREIP